MNDINDIFVDEDRIRFQSIDMRHTIIEPVISHNSENYNIINDNTI